MLGGLFIEDLFVIGILYSSHEECHCLINFPLLIKFLSAEVSL